MEQPRSKSTVYISKFYKIRIAWRKLHQSPYLSHYRNSVNNCFLAQNFTEIGQSGAELWPKTIFKMAVIRHEFETFSYLVIWLSSSFKCAVMHPVSSKLDDFCRAMLCIRAAYAVMRCPSVCLSVRHVHGLRSRYCTVEDNYRQTRSIAWPRCATNILRYGIVRWDEFVEIWRFNYLNFQNLELMSCGLYRHAIYMLPCAKFHWNRSIG